MELDCWFLKNNRLLFVSSFIIFDLMHIWGLNGFFLHFQKGHRLHIIGKQTFDLLHLYWVKIMKDWNVYCCIYHVKMEELRMGLNHMKQKSRLHLKAHYDCEAICGVIDESQSTCVDSHATYPGITRLWKAIVCPKDPHSKWHA
jgi:hypothetical protein